MAVRGRPPPPALCPLTVDTRPLLPGVLDTVNTGCGRQQTRYLFSRDLGAGAAIQERACIRTKPCACWPPSASLLQWLPVLSWPGPHGHGLGCPNPLWEPRGCSSLPQSLPG